MFRKYEEIIKILFRLKSKRRVGILFQYKGFKNQKLIFIIYSLFSNSLFLMFTFLYGVMGDS